MFQKVIGQKPENGISSIGSASEEKASSASSSAPKAPSSAPAPSRQSNAAPSGRNVLSTDVEIKGSIKFSNDLVVDGKIDGSIASDGALTVGENARIKAEIKTRSVIIYGKVHGNIEVTDIVELKANAELVGDIKAASLSIEPGAIFVGKSTVGSPSVKPQASASPAASVSSSSSKDAGKKDSIASKTSENNSTNELPLTSKPSAGSKAVSS
ncbi:MAG: polymer-forming cytoskeletal protein [Akkermansiaceae bacterium]|nr:polymer-forming cytoskeletal protein [Akkermansiaceae bacterium]